MVQYQTVFRATVFRALHKLEERTQYEVCFSILVFLIHGCIVRRPMIQILRRESSRTSVYELVNTLQEVYPEH
jgi:Fe2+ or Zn2+ uptake regulation protein